MGSCAHSTCGALCAHLQRDPELPGGGVTPGAAAPAPSCLFLREAAPTTPSPWPLSLSQATFRGPSPSCLPKGGCSSCLLSTRPAPSPCPCPSPREHFRQRGVCVTRVTHRAGQQLCRRTGAQAVPSQVARSPRLQQPHHSESPLLPAGTFPVSPERDKRPRPCMHRWLQPRSAGHW